jgi:DNA-binding transcriptional ArsR family regulator
MGESSLILDKILKNELRLNIFLLLRLYDELNVTQVSNYLNRSKATVGRHLKAMKNAKILECEEKESNRTINPIYYRIPESINNYLYYEKPPELRGNIQEKIKKLKTTKKKIVQKKYKKEFLVLNIVSKIFKHSISLLRPLIEHLNNKLDEEELDIDYLSKYLLYDNHISLWVQTLSEDVLDEFYELKYEFKKKVEALDSVLPLKELLKLSGNIDID